MTTKGSVAGSSLSYAVAQNIAQQDLFGGHCDEGFFLQNRNQEYHSKDSIRLLSKRKWTKTVKKKNWISPTTIIYYIIVRVPLTQKLIHSCTLSDLDNSNNLIGYLSRTMTLYSPRYVVNIKQNKIAVVNQSWNGCFAKVS